MGQLAAETAEAAASSCDASREVRRLLLSVLSQLRRPDVRLLGESGHEARRLLAAAADVIEELLLHALGGFRFSSLGVHCARLAARFEATPERVVPLNEETLGGFLAWKEVGTWSTAQVALWCRRCTRDALVTPS